MTDLREVKTIVRTDRVEGLLEALQEEGITRFWVSRIHSVGVGVDPESFRLSFEDGGAYTEKAKVEFVAPADRIETLLETIRDKGGTGHRGDGVVLVTEVSNIVNVRTGDRDRLALL